jgi:hypothetical protein
MSAVLLDTNAIIWFMVRNRLEPPALEVIAAAQSAGNVFISPSNRHARSSNAEPCSSEAALSARYSMLMRCGANVTMPIS